MHTHIIHTSGALGAYVHGAHLTLLDGLGAGVGLTPAAASALRAQCAAFLRAQLPDPLQPHAHLAEGDLQV
jgi:midasin